MSYTDVRTAAIESSSHYLLLCGNERCKSIGTSNSKMFQLSSVQKVWLNALNAYVAWVCLRVGLRTTYATTIFAYVRIGVEDVLRDTWATWIAPGCVDRNAYTWAYVMRLSPKCIHQLTKHTALVHLVLKTRLLPSSSDVIPKPPNLLVWGTPIITSWR